MLEIGVGVGVGVGVGRIKAFSPLRRQERKERQESWTSVMLLSELSVLAVKVLSFASKSELVGIFCRIRLKTY